MKTVRPELLDEVVSRLVRLFEPEAIYLFGSHAWGTPSEDSDVDLFVIVPQSAEPPVRRAQRAHRSLIGLDFAKDVLVRTRAEVQEAYRNPASLATAVLTRGRRLYG